MAFLLVLIGTSSSSFTALAQSGDELAAAAQFERGLKEMEQGHYATGCPALAESYRLDPKAGALFTLAECESKWGKIASAVAHYDDYLRLLDRMTPTQRQVQQQREGVAKSRRDELRPSVPTLTINVAPNTPADSVVKRDGVPLRDASRNVALPIDPGEHVLVLEGPDGSQRREERITIAIGEQKQVTLELPAAATPAAGTQSGRANPAIDTPETPAPSRTWTYVAFGGAALAAGVGTVTGALVIGKKSTINAHCVGTTCDDEGKQAADAGQTLGAVSTVSFALAGVGLVVGVVLLLTHPSPATAKRAASSFITAPGAIQASW